MCDFTICENDQIVEAPVENRIIGDVTGTDTEIRFKGTGNILYCEDGVRLENSVLTFCTQNAVIYLSASKRPYKLKIDAWRDTTVFFGQDNYFNGPLSAILSEKRSLIVGGDGVFSFGLWIRTADPHILYDAETKERINPSRSVLIGDHVWLGQNALILKGTEIGSGSVLAAGAVIANKKVESNSVWGGNPAGLIRNGIFYSGASVHDYTEQKTRESQHFEEDIYLFGCEERQLTSEALDKQFFRKTPEERIGILKELSANTDKNRFSIPPERKKSGLRAVFRK